MEKEFDIEVDWRGFELHPETPLGGIELKRRQPPEPGADAKSYIERFAEKFGVEDMKRAARSPNTRRALAVTEYARDFGKQNEFSALLMDAHWKDSLNIEDDSVLKTVAAAIGLDPDKAVQSADNPAYLQRVDAMRIEYKGIGVGGIPAFVFGDKEKVEGCQPYDVLAEAAHRAGAQPR